LTPVQPITAAPPRSLFTSIKEGFGFGVGNSIAMNIFRSDPPRPVVTTVVAPAAASAAPTRSEPKEYTECLEMNGNNKELCKEFLTEEAARR
jgi:hypothetical protein